MDTGRALFAALSLVGGASTDRQSEEPVTLIEKVEEQELKGVLGAAGKAHLAHLYLGRTQGGRPSDVTRARQLLEGVCFDGDIYVENQEVPVTAKCSLANLYAQGRGGPRDPLKARIVCIHIMIHGPEITLPERQAVDSARKLANTVFTITLEPLYSYYKVAHDFFRGANYMAAGTVLEGSIFTNSSLAYKSPETMMLATLLKARMLAEGYAYGKNSARAITLLQEVVDYAKNIDASLHTQALRLLQYEQSKIAPP